MHVLIAEDDGVSRSLLNGIVHKWGYEPIITSDGSKAWEILKREDAPRLVLLDWEMPGMDGIEICQRIRAQETPEPPYLILITARTSKSDMVSGFEAGANDYITKPFDCDILRARLQVGRQVVELRRNLAERVRELEGALSQVQLLQGMLPICAYCRKVRDDQNYWHQVESYVQERCEVRFSHGICPDCLEQEMVKFQAAG